MTLAVERLKELLTYDETAGLFHWRVDRGNGASAGDIAGCLDKSGYYKIRVDGVLYYAHRLAFLYENGYLPPEVDHQNTEKSDTKKANLRAANRSLNNANRSVRSDSKSGIKGVYWNGRSWVARIKQHYLGSFPTSEQASAAFGAAAIAEYGEFARF